MQDFDTLYFDRLYLLKIFADVIGLLQYRLYYFDCDEQIVKNNVNWVSVLHSSTWNFNLTFLDFLTERIFRTSCRERTKTNRRE